MTGQRQAHAVMDMPSRRLKAMKIERLLELDVGTTPLRMLEVGCGSGGISHYFGTHPSGRFDMHAVDVKDSRAVTEGYAYQQVSDTMLPFPDDSFDAVISNHVIEHVGDEAAQLRHLQELRRVLRPGGSGYLAVPNRWMLVEPHYRLIFLSWLPVGFRSGYLSLMRGVDYYDCKPLAMGELEVMLEASGYDFSNRCVDAVRAMLVIEGNRGILRRIVSWLPNRILALFNPVNPTLIYIFSHRNSMKTDEPESLL